MTPRNVKYTRDPAPLRCYKCGRTTNLRVGNDVVLRRRRKRGEEASKRREHVPVDCPGCGNQWYSSHPAAIARSRQQDANLARRHKTPKAKAS